MIAAADGGPCPGVPRLDRPAAPRRLRVLRRSREPPARHAPRRRRDHADPRPRPRGAWDRRGLSRAVARRAVAVSVVPPRYRLAVPLLCLAVSLSLVAVESPAFGA